VVLDLAEPPDNRDSLVLPDQQDYLDPLDLLELLGRKDRKVLSALLALTVLLALPARLALQVLLEIKDQMVSLETRVRLVPMALLDYLVIRDHRDQVEVSAM